MPVPLNDGFALLAPDFALCCPSKTTIRQTDAAYFIGFSHRVAHAEMNGPFKKNAGHGLNGSRRRSHSVDQSSGASGAAGGAASSSGGGRKTNGKGHVIQEEREDEEESERRLELVELENGASSLSCLTALRCWGRVPDPALNFSSSAQLKAQLNRMHQQLMETPSSTGAHSRSESFSMAGGQMPQSSPTFLGASSSCSSFSFLRLILSPLSLRCSVTSTVRWIALRRRRRPHLASLPAQPLPAPLSLMDANPSNNASPLLNPPTSPPPTSPPPSSTTRLAFALPIHQPTATTAVPPAAYSASESRDGVHGQLDSSV